MTKRIEVWDDTNSVRAFPRVFEDSIQETETELRFQQDTPRHDLVIINKTKSLIILVLNELEGD